MIGHDYIADNKMPPALQIVKPFVHCVIAIGYFKQFYPTGTGEGDEIEAIVFWYVFSYTHLSPLLDFLLRRVCRFEDSAFCDLYCPLLSQLLLPSESPCGRLCGERDFLLSRVSRFKDSAPCYLYCPLLSQLASVRVPEAGDSAEKGRGDSAEKESPVSRLCAFHI